MLGGKAVQAPGSPFRWAVVASLALLVGYHLVLLATGVAAAGKGGAAFVQLSDPDDYTRLLRVRQLLADWNWYSPRLWALNAPVGIDLHWTRPLDVLLLVGTAFGAPLVGTNRALHLAGSLIGPLLHLLTVFAVLPAARRFLSPLGLVVACLIWAPLRSVTGSFQLGDPDHHGLILLLVLCAAVAISLSQERRHAAWAGGFAGAAIWVSPEALLLLLPLSLPLGLAWALDGRGGERGTALGLALSAVLAAGLAIERPPAQWLVIDPDRLSMLHLVTGLALAFGFWLLSRAAHVRRVSTRIGLGCCVGGGLVAALLILFPELSHDPIRNLPPLVMADLIAVVSGEERLEALSRAGLFHLWPAGPALVWSAIGLFRALRTKDPSSRDRHLFTLVAVSFLAAYTVGMRSRGSLLLAAVALLPWAELTHCVIRAAIGRWRINRPVFASAAGASALLLAFGYWLTVPAALFLDGERFAEAPSCPLDQLAPFLVPSLPPGKTILTSLFDAPELAYRTGAGAVGGPYHQNLDGIADTRAAFKTSDETELLRILRRRQVGVVVLCLLMDRDQVSDLRRNPGRMDSRLYGRAPPSGLRRVPLPAELDRWFVVYTPN